MPLLDISGIPEAVLLASFYNRAAPTTPAEMADPRTMSLQEASTIWQDHLSRGETNIDAIQDRNIDLDLGRKQVDTALYNALNGAGAAEDVMHALRSDQEPPVWTLDESEFERFSERATYEQLLAQAPAREQAASQAKPEIHSGVNVQVHGATMIAQADATLGEALGKRFDHVFRVNGSYRF